MAIVVPHISSRRIEDLEVRVEDYLNDKLQTHADLDNLDSLLATVQQQQKLLLQQVSYIVDIVIHEFLKLNRKQLHDAEAALEQAHNASKTHSNSLHQEAEKFKTKQADIDRRLMIVTQSETSDDAVMKFNDSIEKLGRLDVAKGYMDILKEVDQLR